MLFLWSFKEKSNKKSFGFYHKKKVWNSAICVLNTLRWTSWFSVNHFFSILMAEIFLLHHCVSIALCSLLTHVLGVRIPCALSQNRWKRPDLKGCSTLRLLASENLALFTKEAISDTWSPHERTSCSSSRGRAPTPPPEPSGNGGWTGPRTCWNYRSVIVTFTTK